jgi:selenocysteine lyase/cysteine desulfurase
LREIPAYTARRFQGGTLNIIGISIIATLRYILDIRIENIKPYVIGLRDK